MIPFSGTLIDAASIIIGTLIGLSLGKIITDRFREILYQALGLSVFFIGISIALKGQNAIILLGSMCLGSISGELISIDQKINRLELKLSERFSNFKSNIGNAFITSTLVFCVGSMAILGSIEEGLKNEPTILLAKSFLDGISAIIFASSMGIGVLFSSVSVLLYQGTITLFSLWFGSILGETVINNISAVGGVIIVAISLNILGIARIRVPNLLPAIIFAFLLSFF